MFHRTLREAPIIATSAQGSYITDKDGKRYLDACGGAAVSCLGHGHPVVVEAIAKQAARMAFVHNSFFSADVTEELADLLSANAPAPGSRVYFVSGGSEAVETAVKMAHQYHRERGEPGRRHLIGRWQSYHGNTLGALSVGGNRGRRKVYEALLVETHHISPCYEYRGRAAGETAEAYGLRVADELEATIQRLGPETVSAFIAEPVVGATLGAVPAVPGYFRRIREICDRHGVLLILDEIMCGMGRTGPLHACTAEGVVPDIMTIAKGLGGGYVPLGAVLASPGVVDAFVRGSGAFNHGHTFVGHPLACASALAVQKHIADENLLERVVEQGTVLAALLNERFAQNPYVGDIRGRGLFQALELVEDRETRRPFPAGKQLAGRLKAEAQALGLLCYPMPGVADGTDGDHVLLAPAYTVSTDELDEAVDLLARALRRVLP